MAKKSPIVARPADTQISEKTGKNVASLNVADDAMDKAKGDPGNELRMMVVTLRYRSPRRLTVDQMTAVMDMEEKSLGVDRSVGMDRMMKMMDAAEVEAKRSSPAATETLKE